MNQDSNGQQFTSKKEMFRVFRALQLTHSLLSIKFHGESREYSSLLLNADLDKEELVFDELIPDEGNAKLKGGEPFTLIGVYEGIHVHCRFKGMRSKTPSGYDHAFSAGFPEVIHHKQRREAYRATIDQYDDSKISAANDDRESAIAGKVVDLSTTGLGAEFPKFIRPEIKAGEKFPNCNIAVNQQFSIHCTLIARHPRYEKSTGLYFCGFEFHGLSRLQQKQVDRYIIELQQTARRNDVRRMANH